MPSRTGPFRRRSTDFAKSSSQEFLSQTVARLDADSKNLSDSLMQFKQDFGDRLHGIERSIQILADKFSQKQQVNWPLVVSILVATVVVLGFVGNFMLAPVNARITWIEATQQRFEGSLIANSASQHELARSASAAREKMSEIESQFIAASHIRNLQIQKMELKLLMVAQKAGVTVQLPEDDYYPVIGKEERSRVLSLT